ncbi:hypothetical protein BA1DRAFT_04169 [Photorhabdus aegyptia]|uniref:Uncharacterized protein n=1 Tax=Photorhabdus aegyptia TaxID=2805098 RepID=A0A022PCT8_9GAMM|nr:hypothetical protein BA1DRAFT_04169 [Photorhabdus aegyptia]
MIYLVEPTEENTRIAGEKIKVYDYPDGTLGFKYRHRSLTYQIFDKLDCVDQGQIVDNKRLRMPRRRAQARVQEQLRAINPVLVNPEEFRASLKR